MSERVNRGPAAAAENRAAIIRAAGEIFSEQGLGAPLNAIAKRAGVGQGSLYRHFPTRASLAIAAFDAGLSEIEALADRTGSLSDVLRLVTDQAMASVAFLELVVPLAHDPSAAGLGERIQTVIEHTIDDGRASGTVPPEYTVTDVLMAIRMIAGALGGSVAEEREQLVADGWRLLGIRLS